MPMTAAEFKKKWSRYQGKETSAYQKDDLFICRDVAIDDKTAANLALQCRLKTI
jgi:adenine-specific DNA-methyltransferase